MVGGFSNKFDVCAVCVKKLITGIQAAGDALSHVILNQIFDNDAILCTH